MIFKYYFQYFIWAKRELLRSQSRLGLEIYHPLCNPENIERGREKDLFEFLIFAYSS